MAESWDNGALVTYVDELLRTSEIDEGRRRRIEKDLWSYSREELDRLVEYLSRHQRKTLDQQFKERLKREQ